MSIIVNTDYESVLFHQRPSLKMVRELEFLALWLTEEVQNVQSYDESYLAHIQQLTGNKPQLVNKASNKARNWWGSLTHLEKERFLNSKKTSFEISQTFGENFGRIIENESELSLLDKSITYLFKSYSGVSGKGHKSLSQIKSQDYPLIAEVLHQREFDFSTYCFSSGKKIFYQNLISDYFGYKGSLFDLENASSLKELSFAKKYTYLNWDHYLEKVDYIYDFVRKVGDGGFSIDSYIFKNNIRALCEINYRRTMGLCAFEIAQRISHKRFQLFLILKTNKNFGQLWEIADSLKIVLLSPETSFFSYFLISEDSLTEIQHQLTTLESILGTSLSIKIQ